MNEEAKSDAVSDRNSAPCNAYVSMYSMVVTLRQLAEMYDVNPGRDERLRALNELAIEFSRFTVRK